VIPYGMRVPVAVRRVANCYTPFTFYAYLSNSCIMILDVSHRHARIWHSYCVYVKLSSFDVIVCLLLYLHACTALHTVLSACQLHHVFVHCCNFQKYFVRCEQVVIISLNKYVRRQTVPMPLCVKYGRRCTYTKYYFCIGLAC